MFSYIAKLEAKHQTTFAVVVGFAVVCFWRGVWGLLDVFFFPDDLMKSYFGSFALGLMILVATHYIVQIMLNKA